MRAVSWVVSAALVLGGLLAPLPSNAQADGAVYVVQEGDTLTAIAERFGTTVEAIAALNGLSDPSRIFPGTELLLPGFTDVSGLLVAHPVEFGESLHSLSRRYGAEPESLMRWNRLVNPDRLYVGQELITVEGREGERPAGEARSILLGPARTLVETAAGAGVDPWAIRIHNGRADRSWVVPGEVTWVPGGEAPARALPEPLERVAVDPLPAVQGRTVIVRAAVSSTADLLQGRLGDRALTFYRPDATQQVALQGIHALAEPGFYDLEISLAPAGDGRPRFRHLQPVRVISGGYRFDPVLIVPPETIDPEITGPENELFFSVLSQSSPEKLWEGPFGSPSPYPESFTSLFGSRRNYNNTGYNYYHSGLDFGGGTGTPIFAPAPGVVAFAGELTVRGNTTILDHGWGVFTAYQHQSAILVAVGQSVQMGETIGLVGGTGRVTGPHLHWEVWVGGVAVDPREWTARAFP